MKYVIIIDVIGLFYQHRTISQFEQVGKRKFILLKKKTKIIIFVVLPILVASLAIACAGTSLIGLLLGSWYIQRFSGDIGSKWLLVLTIFSVFLSCM